MDPWLFWAPRDLGPEKFGPRKIWAQRILVPAWKYHILIFMWGLNFLEPKFLGAQISRGPNFLGTKKVRGPNEIEDHFSYSLYSWLQFICWLVNFPIEFLISDILDSQINMTTTQLQSSLLSIIFKLKINWYWDMYDRLALVKVSKSRKQILKFLFEPKDERKYFCISALKKLI